MINSTEVLFFDVILTFFSSFSPKRVAKELRVDYGNSQPVLHEFRVLCMLIITFAQSVRMFLVVTGADFPQLNPILWAWTKESSSYSWDLMYFLIGFCLAYHMNGLLKVLSSSPIEQVLHIHANNFHHFTVVFIVQLMRWVVRKRLRGDYYTNWNTFFLE